MGGDQFPGTQLQFLTHQLKNCNHLFLLLWIQTELFTGSSLVQTRDDCQYSIGAVVNLKALLNTMGSAHSRYGSVSNPDQLVRVTDPDPSIIKHK